MPANIYPYQTLFGDVVLALEAVEIDGEPVPGHVLDVDGRRLLLTDLGRQEWDEISFELAARLPTDEIEELRQQESDVSIQVLAVFHCAPTNERRRISLVRDEYSTSEWRGTCRLNRSAFEGSVRCTALVTASSSAGEHRWLGESVVWTIQFDQRPNVAREGPIRIRWVDFSAPAEDAPRVLRRYKPEPFYLDLTNERDPVLYLNEGLDSLRALPWDKRRPRKGVAMRDLIQNGVARAVWPALVESSMSAIIEPADEEEAPSWPAEDWQSTVLKSVLSKLYPSISSADRRLAKAYEDWRDPDGMLKFQSRLGAIIGRMVNEARTIDGSLRTLSEEG